MTINECNPHVRYAKRHSNIRKSYPWVYTVDNRLFYFTGGEGVFELEHTTYPIHKDVAILFQSGTKYRITIENSISHIPINFDYTQDYAHMKFAPQNLETDSPKIPPLSKTIFTDFPSLNEEIYMPNAKFILTDVIKLTDEKLKMPPGYQAYCSSVMKKIICKILRSNSSYSNNENDKANRILAFIHENYATHITNDTIAAHINYHPYYVNKLFYSYTGMTVHQYVNHYRLDIAAHLLSTTQEPINHICYAVGFQTPAHFTMNFKKKYGVSPKEFRKLEL